MGILGPNFGRTIISSTPQDLIAEEGLPLPSESDSIKIADFGFEIPKDATITNITVNIDPPDDAVDEPAQSYSTKDETITKEDLLDPEVVAVKLSRHDVNSSDFGVVIPTGKLPSGENTIEKVSVTIEYEGSNRAGNQVHRFSAGEGMSVTEGSL